MFSARLAVFAQAPSEGEISCGRAYSRHFGAYDDQPPSYDIISIRGASPNDELRQILREDGYSEIVLTVDGFRASRRAPEPEADRHDQARDAP